MKFGRYQLVDRLAIGGMAELFLAQAQGAHGFAKTLVIKRILPHLVADKQFTSMFIDEAKLTARLAHPKIAQTFELGTEGDRLYIAMEYVEGLDVLAILRECAHRRVRVASEISVYICKEVLDALDFAHKQCDDQGNQLGIVHRDISPSNVLISRRGDVKLVDFGIAHALHNDHHTKAGTLKGKYGYMSPEQVLGQKLTAKSDLFSVGVVLCEMLTGRRLFAAPNELDVLLMVRDVKLDRLDRFGTHVPADLMALLKRGLAKDPNDRYGDAGQFRDALDEWLFDNRHRVTPKNIADLVESLHDDAAQRRKTSLAEAAAQPGEAAPADGGVGAAAQAAVVSQVRSQVKPVEVKSSAKIATPPQAAPQAAEAVSDLIGGMIDVELDSNAVPESPAADLELDLGNHGLPADLGMDNDLSQDLGLEESLPRLELSTANETPAVEVPDRLELDLGLDEDAMPAKSAKPAKSKPQRPPPAAAPREQAANRRSIPGAMGGALGSAAQTELAASAITASGAIELAESPQSSSSTMHRQVRGGGGAVDDTRAPSKGQKPASGRSSVERVNTGRAATGVRPSPIGQNGSISAAVASVAPQDADPSARDFDGTDVGASKIRKRLPRRLTEDDILNAPKPPLPDVPIQEDTPAEQGDLSQTPPLQILFRIGLAKSTGLLAIGVGEIRKEIYVADGVPEYVSSNLAGELFGNYLVKEGAISSGELDMALAMLPYFSGKLGDTLVGLGLMKPLDVFRHLTKQVRGKLLDVCTWNKGSYAWYPGKKNPRESFPLDLDPFEVLGAGAMQLPVDIVKRWCDRNAGKILRTVAKPSVVPDQFRLGKPGRETLNHFDGKKPVGDIVKKIPEADLASFLRVTYLFVNTGNLKET